MISQKWGPWPALATAVMTVLVLLLIVAPYLRQEANARNEHATAEFSISSPSVSGRTPESEPRITLQLAWVSTIAWVSAIAWGTVVVLVAYQLSFTILATLWPPRGIRPETPSLHSLEFCLLYATCDDFVEDCATACLAQQYPANLFRVVICDDSRTSHALAQVNSFLGRNPVALLSRRNDRVGFKAGNLNTAFERHCNDRCDWVVVVDADELLPPDFLARLARQAVELPVDVAYVQCGRRPRCELPFPDSACVVTPFQSALQHEIRLFMDRSMPWREQLGFSPFLGHSGAVRKSVWKSLGGIPLRVSEDLALSMRVLAAGGWGVRLEGIDSFEDFPPDFTAFGVRLRKFAGGAAELVRTELPRFLRSGATWTDKVDSTLWLAAYLTPLIVVVNLPISAYLAGLATEEYAGILAVHLPYVFFVMAAYTLAVAISVMPTVADAIRYWLWAFAVYGASFPGMAGAFLKGLFVSPQFQRTPKFPSAGTRMRWYEIVPVAVGATGIGLALSWWSPFSPIFGAFAAAYGLSPFWHCLHHMNDWRGSCARGLIYAPGLLYLWGMVWMWLDSGV